MFTPPPDTPFSHIFIHDLLMTLFFHPPTPRGRPAVDDVGGGSRPAAGSTQATVPLPYPRYVLRGLLKTAASRAPCARRELLASLLFAPAWGLDCMAEIGPSAVGEK